MTSDITKTEIQLEYYHWLIHLGRLFYNSDITTGASAYNFYILPGSLPVHIIASISAGAATVFQLIENPTVTSNGTLVPPINHNRVSSNTMTALGYKGCTYTGGTVIRNNQAGFGSNPGQATSGNNSTELEYILKPNTPYVMLITPSTSTTVVTESEMYELALS